MDSGDGNAVTSYAATALFAGSKANREQLIQTHNLREDFTTQREISFRQTASRKEEGKEEKKWKEFSSIQ